MLYKIQKEERYVQKIFEEIMAKNFPKVVKNVNLQI